MNPEMIDALVAKKMISKATADEWKAKFAAGAQPGSANVGASATPAPGGLTGAAKDAGAGVASMGKEIKDYVIEGGRETMDAGTSMLGSAAPKATMQPLKTPLGSQVPHGSWAHAVHTAYEDPRPVPPPAPNPQVAFGFAPEGGPAPMPVSHADVDALVQQGKLSEPAAAGYKAQLAKGNPAMNTYVPPMSMVAGVESVDAKRPGAESNPIIQSATGGGVPATPMFGAAKPVKPAEEPRSKLEADRMRAR